MGAAIGYTLIQLSNPAFNCVYLRNWQGMYQLFLQVIGVCILERETVTFRGIVFIYIGSKRCINNVYCFFLFLISELVAEQPLKYCQFQVPLQ